MDNATAGLTFQALFALVLSIIISSFIMRAIFSIPQILKHQRAIIKLLALNAEKNGADEDLIKEIVFESDPKFINDEHFKTDEPDQSKA